MTSVRMRDYELVMILSPEATEAEASETVDRITGLISEGGGSVADQDHWGIRRLAYPIQRFIEGNYFISRCKMDAQAAVELDNTLNTSQDVLRHLVFRLDQADLAAMEKQAERERAARQENERRATAEREAREREEARRQAEAEAAEAKKSSEAAEAEAQEGTEAEEVAPVQAEASAQPSEEESSEEVAGEVTEETPVEAEASAQPSEGESSEEVESKEGE